ncbi:unnamed protein product [Brassica rapa subsp. narinosa]
MDVLKGVNDVLCKCYCSYCLFVSFAGGLHVVSL